MEKLFIKDLDLRGKRVLMRVDFNVPLTSDLEIEDATRIEAALPSIKYVLERGGSLVLMSHMGRPHETYDPELSLRPCALFLERLLGKKVTMAPNCVGHEVRELIKKMSAGDIVLLENLRFHRAEEKPEEDPSFAEELASFGEVYVDDAFGSAHRKHASIYAVPQLFPGLAAGGFLLNQEIGVLSQLLNSPGRPFFALIGGAKVSSKIGCLKSLLKKVDQLLIGGAMSFTFLKALGKEIGDSKCEPDFIKDAEEILKEAENRVILPVDIIGADRFSEDAKTMICDLEKGIPQGYRGLDIGPQTIELFSGHLRQAKTIFWNGPLGVFEMEPFSHGTLSIGEVIAQNQGFKVIAGGDTVSAWNEIHKEKGRCYVSTGGGASLEFLEWGTLPGIEVLSDKK